MDVGRIRRFLFSPRAKSREPLRPHEYVVFLSSGDDALALRDRAERIFAVVNDQFGTVGLPVRFRVDRWEQTAAQRMPSGRVNDAFVERAIASDLTLVLIRDELRPGTREELDAVLLTRDVELAVILFPETGQSTEEVEGYLQSKGEVFYRIGGPEDADDSWMELIKVAVRAIATQQQTGGLTPTRRVEAEPKIGSSPSAV